MEGAGVVRHAARRDGASGGISGDEVKRRRVERKLANRPSAVADPVDKEVRSEAIGALTMLGFSPAPSAKVVGEILRQHPGLPVEQVVKLALKQIK